MGWHQPHTARPKPHTTRSTLRTISAWSRRAARRQQLAWRGVGSGCLGGGSRLTATHHSGRQRVGGAGWPSTAAAAPSCGLRRFSAGRPAAERAEVEFGGADGTELCVAAAEAPGPGGPLEADDALLPVGKLHHFSSSRKASARTKIFRCVRLGTAGDEQKPQVHTEFSARSLNKDVGGSHGTSLGRGAPDP